jgi:hypothetical protein
MNIRIKVHISSKILQDKREWDAIFKILKKTLSTNKTITSKITLQKLRRNENFPK